MKLGREHLGKIVRIDDVVVIEVPDGVFKEGDIMVLFNNTDRFTTIHSKVKNSYRSASLQRSMVEFPPRSLINIIFVADDTVVFTVGF
jgi:hypothetical protein